MKIKKNLITLMFFSSDNSTIEIINVIHQTRMKFGIIISKAQENNTKSKTNNENPGTTQGKMMKKSRKI